MTEQPPAWPPDWPPSNWQPPWPPPVREPGLLERTVVDQQVAESVATRPPWPGRAVWGPVAVLIALIVVANLPVRALVSPSGRAGSVAAAAVSIAAEVVLLGAILALSRGVAASEGGWGRAFGLRWPQRGDWLPWVLGLVMVFLARIFVAGAANVATHGRAAGEASNVALRQVSPASVIALVLLAVVLAPVTEELMFRGILLRALMRRVRFWPAALISTAVFAALHAYEVQTLAGALTLVGVVGVLGLTNCYLVRITGRLAPGMLVHATFNLLAVLVVVLRH